MAVQATTAPRVGDLLREWRQRRSLSQMAVASDSAVSTRYLSFIETGRATPSREMILHLAEQLEVPLRERNTLLLAAGYAPIYPERSLDDPELAPVQDAIDRFLEAHQPYPALVVDRHWNMLAANQAADLFTDGAAAELLEPPANVLRIALHPDGLAPRILNLGEWSAHMLGLLRREAAITGDPVLGGLYDELAGYPGVHAERSHEEMNPGAMLMHRFTIRDRQLAFFSTVTTFGRPSDVTLQELTIEAFYPADIQTLNRSARAGRLDLAQSWT